MDESANGSERAAGTRIAVWGLVLSIVAIAVSVITFAFPIVQRQQLQGDVAGKYLKALVGDNVSSPYVAQGMASEGSQAGEFAETIGLVWKAIADSEVDVSDVRPGTTTPLGDGKYKVCFPDLPIFPSKCAVYGDFEFSDGARVSRFTIDGQPVEHLFRAAEYDKTLTSQDGTAQMRAYSAGRLWDPDSKDKTLVLWIDRGAGVKSKGRDDLVPSKIMAQDRNEEEVPVIASYFPSKFSYYDSYNAVVRLPESARFLWVCWEGGPPDESACDWVYNLK